MILPTVGSTSVRTDSIDEALLELAAGKPVIVLDDADRENEGDLIMAAEFATEEWMAFFVRYGSGYVCVPLDENRADALDLPLMVRKNEESMRTAFTVTVDARFGVGTGISAADRAHTVRLLAAATTSPDDLVRPGHIAPLRARAGGVLTRPGHTEAAVDLCRLAGLRPTGVIVELVEDSGRMRRAQSCREFADEHGLLLVTIEDLVAYRREQGTRAQVKTVRTMDCAVVTRGATTQLPTAFGDFVAVGYQDDSRNELVALVLGDIGDGEEVLTRVHSECLTGDALASLRCDCGPQLQVAMRAIARHGRGVVVYQRGHEGRGVGLLRKLSAYALQDQGRDTVDANLELGLPIDCRDYTASAEVLKDLGVRSLVLMTNNPDKVEAMNEAGMVVVERVSVLPPTTVQNAGYLRTKQERLGHDLPHLVSVPLDLDDLGLDCEDAERGVAGRTADMIRASLSVVSGDRS